MTREEFESQLKSLDFHFEREEEYHRDVFINDHYKFVRFQKYEYKVSIVIYVDRYTTRIIWWLDNSHRLTKSYYMNKDVKDLPLAVSLISSFINYCEETYKVNVEIYKV